MDHRPEPAAGSDGFVAALGSSLRRTVAEHQALQQLLRSTTVLTARRTAARTARRLAPETADRLISQLKGTAPLLGMLPEQVRAQVRTRSAALKASAAFTVAAVVGSGLVGSAPSALADVGPRAAAQVSTQGTSPQPVDGDTTSATGSTSGPAIYPRPQREQSQGAPVARPARVALAVAPHADPGALAALQA
ncbi:hypothetical protein, partial [Streptacidiphilus melanogenes]|uniref:hypothetical protein n=1 Tax=Streptacidiphilus melanogenes TaxID=411235 RepID=UPI0005AB04F8